MKSKTSLGFWTFIIFLFSFTSNSFGQTIDTLYKNDSGTFSRFRVLFGPKLVSYEDDKVILAVFPSLNLSYRSTWLPRDCKPLEASFAFEPGTDVILVIADDTGLIAFPYLKAGPEIYLGKNYLISLDGGIMISFYSGDSNFIWPFAGINLHFLKIREKLTFEFQLGAKVVESFEEDYPFEVYLNIGFAIK